jgi:hypothetical protein
MGREQWVCLPFGNPRGMKLGCGFAQLETVLRVINPV